LRMEELREKYENLMEAFSLLRALGIPIGLEVSRMFVDEKGRVNVHGTVLMGREFRTELEILLTEAFNDVLSAPEHFRDDLKGLADAVREDAGRYEEETGGDVADFVILVMLTQVLAGIVATASGIPPSEVAKHMDPLYKVAGMLLGTYKEDRELRDEYELWRSQAELLLKQLKRMRLL